MNKRELQKKKTRQHLLETARDAFISKGFLQTSTAEISRKAGVAHGTLFVHFKSKDILIVEIIDDVMDSVSEEMQKLGSKTDNPLEMLELYLDFLIEQEDLFSVLARELPFYQEELRRKIIFREAIIRENFHTELAEGIERGEFRNIDVSSALNFLFGVINLYLSRKTSYISEGSVIAKFKPSILRTFQQMINETNHETKHQIHETNGGDHE